MHFSELRVYMHLYCINAYIKLHFTCVTLPPHTYVDILTALKVLKCN